MKRRALRPFSRFHLFSPSVIVRDFHIISVAIPPPKADSILVVDPDAVLPSAITLESFQPVSWESAQIGKPVRSVKHAQFLECGSCATLKLPALPGRVQPFGFTIVEGLDQVPPV
jgi:hypothetical protein